MRAQTPPPVRRLLGAFSGAGPRVDDAVRTAAGAGLAVALGGDPAGVDGLAAAGGPGHPGIGTTGPRLVAIAGERAARNERAPDSWEYAMPWQVRREQQRRLVAGGYRVRVVLRSGPGSPATVLRRPAGRS